MQLATVTKLNRTEQMEHVTLRREVPSLASAYSRTTQLGVHQQLHHATNRLRPVQNLRYVPTRTYCPMESTGASAPMTYASRFEHKYQPMCVVSRIATKLNNASCLL
jgi:hypothetical protein